MYSNNYNRNNYHYNSFSNNNGYNYNSSWNRTSGRNSRNSRNTPTNIPPNPIHRNNHNKLNNFNNNGINNPYNINNNYLNNRNNNNYKINNKLLPHHIELLEGSKPIKQKAYKISQVQLLALKEELKKLMDKGLILSFHSPWSSPIVLVPKKNGRWCKDVIIPITF